MVCSREYACRQIVNYHIQRHGRRTGINNCPWVDASKLQLAKFARDLNQILWCFYIEIEAPHDFERIYLSVCVTALDIG